MAKKRISRREAGWSLLYSPFTEEELNDPSVVELSERLRQEKEDTARPVDFSNVVGQSNTVAEPTPEPGVLQSIDNWGQNMGDVLSGSLGGWAQGLLGSASIASADAGKIFKDNVGETLTRLFPGIGLLDLADPTGEIRQQMGRDLVLKGAASKQEAVETARREKPVFGSETLSVGAADVAGSPTGVASLFGVGALGAGADAFLQQYGQNRVQGVDVPGSALQAAPQAAIEFGLERIRAGEFATKIPGVKKILGNEADDVVKGSLERFIRRTSRNLVGESSEEMLTTAAQAAADWSIVQNAPDSEAAKAARANLPANMTEFGMNVIRSGVAGAMGAGTVGNGSTVMQITAENAQRFHDLLDEAAGARTRREDIKARKEQEKTDRVTEIEAQLARHRADAATIQAKMDEYAKANNVTLRPGSNATLTKLQKSIDELENERSSLLGTQPAAPTQPATPAKKTRKKTTQKMQQFAGTRNQINETPVENEDNFTSDHVYASLLKKVGSKDTGVVHGLISKGKLKIVDDASEIPDKAAQVPGTAGYYDGKQTYVVANQLDRKNPVGSLLDVAAHEVHHGAQASGAVTLAGFVGEDTDRLVNSIESLAKEGDPRAQQVIRAAQASEKVNKGSYKDEVLGYAITVQRGARNKNTLFGRAVGNIVSAVRNKAGINASFDDVAYLSDKLLQKAAVTDKDLKAKGIDPDTVVTRNMIIPDLTENDSPRHYTSIDGTRKFEISDRDSNVRGDVIDQLRKEGVTGATTVGALLNHPRLYQALDQAQGGRNHVTDARVEFLPLGPRMLGYYSEGSNTITLNSGLLHRDDAKDWNGAVHRILLHEIQHIIQRKGKAQGGTNANYVASVQEPEVRKLDAKIQIRNDQLENAQKVVDTFDRIINHRDTDEHERVRLRRNRATAWKNVEDLRKEINDLTKQQQDLRDKYHPIYEASLGEREARRAEQRIHRSQESIDSVRPGAHEGEYLADGVYDEEGNLLEPQNTEQLKAMQEAADQPSIGRAINVQNLQDVVDETQEERSRFWNFTVKWLANDNVYLGRELNMIREQAEGYRTSILHKADILGTRLNDAIDNAAVLHKTDRAEIISKISERLNALSDKMDIDTRRSIVRALDRQYPGVGKALDDIRTFKLQLSKEIIGLRLADIKDNPLSKKEIGVYNAMMKNEETYTTRAYLAMIKSNKIGEDYARNLLRTYNRDPDSESGKVVQRALDYLIKHDLVIPPVEQLEDLKWEDLKRVYETWIGKAPKGRRGEARERMIKRLKAMPPKTKQEIFDKAYSTAKSLLGLTGQPTAISTYYRGGKQNRTIVEGRRNVPAPIRELLGEITDPVLREMLSLSRMAGFIGKTQVLTDVYEKGKDKWWSDEDTKNTPMRLSGEEYGPLNGKYVTRRLYDVLGTSVELEKSVSAMVEDTVRNPENVAAMIGRRAGMVGEKVSKAYKTSVLAYNPFAMLRNWVGSFLMAAQNGLYTNPQDILVGQINTAKSLLAISRKRQGDKSLTKTLEYQQAGIFDTATMGEIKSGLWDDMLRDISELDPTDKTSTQKLRKLMRKYVSGNGSKLGKTNEFLRSAYAGMDMWVKASTYENRKRFLTDYYSAEGISKSEKEIIAQAGYETNLVNITYKNASNIVKATEKFASPIAMFLTYYSEVYRANFASYALAARDLALANNAKTEEGRRLATVISAKRMTGTLATSMGLNAVMLTFLGGASEEEKRKRLLDAEWEKYDVLINLGLTKEGNEVMLGFSQIDPNGPMNEAMRTLLSEDDTEDALRKITAGFFTQNRMSIAVMNLLRDVAVHTAGVEGTDADHRRKRTTQLQQNWPEIYAALANNLSAGDVGENLAEVIDAGVPGILRPLYRIHSPDKLAVAASTGKGVTAEIIKDLGGNLYVRKPDRDIGFKIRDYTKGVTAVKRDLLDYLDRTPNISVEDAAARFAKADREEYELYSKLDEAWEGYLAFEPSNEKQDQILKDNRITAGARKALLYGGYDAQVVTPELIDKWYDKQAKDLDEEGLKKLDHIYNILNMAYGKLEDNGN